MNIYESISAVMSDVGAIGKNTKNTQQGFMFRGIDAVMNALQPAMLKNRIFVVPEVLDQTREERQSAKGGNLIYSILRMRYTFYAEDGTSISAVVIGEGMDSGDKASNKAMSIAFKYACFQVFCIPTEEMKDPDAECHTVVSRKQEQVQDIANAKIGEAKVNSIINKCANDGVDVETVLSKMQVKTLGDLTEKQYVWIASNWSKEFKDGGKGAD